MKINHNSKSAEIQIAGIEGARALTTLNYNELRAVNDSFLSYVDPSGISSKSRGGVIIQVNIRIKRYVDLEQPLVEQLQLLAALYTKLSKIISAGMRKQRRRAEIKNELWTTIDQYGPLIKENGV